MKDRALSDCVHLHKALRHILSGIGWPTVAPEFDPYAAPEPTYDVCDLVPGTKDGFQDIEEQVHYDSGLWSTFLRIH